MITKRTDPTRLTAFDAREGSWCIKESWASWRSRRAIGDLDFKETGFLYVLADPELCTHQLCPSDEFILLACDGIYDVMSNEQACAYVREALAAGEDVQAISEKMVKHAIDTLNTRDNVTVILVKLVSDLRNARYADYGLHVVLLISRLSLLPYSLALPT